jgi:anaerobic magnesium-protoporphyrin IX monomethyl ester cyclase
MGKGKVLLLFPRTGFDALKPQMPSSLVYIGTSLKKAGYTPVIVDMRTDKNYKELIKKTIESGCIAVGLSTMTGTQITFGLTLAKYVRSINPKLPLIWGGVHPSIYPKQTIKNEFVDIIIKGEADVSIIEVVDAIAAGKSLEGINGITYQEKGLIRDVPEGKLLDVTTLGKPDWTLINTKNYRIFDVQSARGCPHRCQFCYNKIFNQARWRRRTSECIVDEIEGLVKKYGIKELNFIDDNFFTDKKRSVEMMQDMVDRKLNITWRVNCRADYFDWFTDDFLTLAQKAGLREVLIGCESGSQRILDYMKKDCKVDQIENAIIRCREYGIQAQCSFMMGFPVEKRKDNLKTFDLIDKLRAMDPNVLITAISIYTPYPGSPLFEESKRYGFVPPKTFKDWGDFTYTFVNVPWLSGMKKARYESISYVTRFLFFGDKLEERFITPLLYVPFKILKWDAKLRWKFRFFEFPFEWMLVKAFLVGKRKNQLNGVLAGAGAASSV